MNRSPKSILSALVVFAACASATPVSAQPSAATEDFPKVLSLDAALQMFHARGYDLLVADTSVTSAEADVASAGVIPNPSIGLIYGRVIDNGYTCDSGCSKNAYTIGVSDNGAIFDSLSDKRGLRLAVARGALKVAKLARKDAERVLDLQVKQAWLTVAGATAALSFSKQVADGAKKTLEFNAARFPGKIDEGQLARIQTAKVEAERQVLVAESAVRVARAGLAYLLGVRGKVPEFDAGEPLKFAVPKALAGANEDALERLAFEHRPDYLASKAEKERAQDSLSLAKRLRFPDIQLSAQYFMMGTGQSAIQPPTVSFGVTFTLPSLYRYQGEIKKAQAAIDLSGVQEKKTSATVSTDVRVAYETWATEKKLVEKMEGELLAPAKKARDVTEAQFNEGKALLADFLDAQRTFVATNVEYLQDLTGYWSAVFQLEQAVGMDLRK